MKHSMVRLRGVGYQHAAVVRSTWYWPTLHWAPDHIGSPGVERRTACGRPVVNVEGWREPSSVSCQACLRSKAFAVILAGIVEAKLRRIDS